MPTVFHTRELQIEAKKSRLPEFAWQTSPLCNHSEVPCVHLDIRTTVVSDVCEYPDSGKVAILPVLEVFESRSRVRYFQGKRR